MLISGCTTKEVNWEARRGQYTYAEAVQHYGEPAWVDQSSAGGKVGYWILPDAQSYAFKFQLPDFESDTASSLNPGPVALPPGGRPLGTVGRPILQLTFGADGLLTEATRIKQPPMPPGGTNSPGGTGSTSP